MTEQANIKPCRTDSGFKCKNGTLEKLAEWNWLKKQNAETKYLTRFKKK